MVAPPKVGVGPRLRLKLFQYWNTATPPPEVAGWIADFRSRNPEFDHVLFDEVSAAAFIRRWFGAREEAAFQACAVPAMQADVIRLCAILVHGGVWVDADNQSLRPLKELIDQAPHSLVFSWTGLLNNGFLWFKEADSPLLRACLDLTWENIHARRFQTEFTATGPGVLNAVRALLDPDAVPQMLAAFDNPMCRPWGFAELIEHAKSSVQVTPELIQSYKSLTIMNALAARPWIGSEQPAYKQTKQHWLNWEEPIYRS